MTGRIRGSHQHYPATEKDAVEEAVHGVGVGAGGAAAAVATLAMLRNVEV